MKNARRVTPPPAPYARPDPGNEMPLNREYAVPRYGKIRPLDAATAAAIHALDARMEMRRMRALNGAMPGVLAVLKMGES